MNKKQNRDTMLVLGILLLTGLLVAVIVVSLWRMQTHEAVGLGLLITAIAICGALLFLAVLIALPESKAGIADDVRPPESHHRREYSDKSDKKETLKDAEKIYEALVTIEAISQQLDHVVGQVRGRLQGIAPAADDRSRDEQREVTGDTLTLTEHGTPRIH